MFAYLYEKDIEGTYIQERIKRVAKDESGGIIYKPRDQGKSNNLEKYTADQIEKIKNELREINIFYGFHKCEQNPNSVLEYSNLTEEELKMEHGFERTN